jgi:ribosomal-protein-alanine N-acetyltransferase
VAKYGPEKFELNNGEMILFRHCNATDVDKFPEFQQWIVKESTNTLQVEGQVPPLEKVKENWLMCESDERYLRLGAFHNEKLIAQLGLRPVHAEHPWLQHIGSFGMMVLKEYWGQGIGRKMLGIMEDHARICGYTRIEAMVRVENERGVRLYANKGYTIEGIRKNAAFINGSFRNEYYLGKLLTDIKTDDSWLPPQLSTDRLLLRPLHQSDAESIFEYARNPNVSMYTLWEPHETVADSLAFIVEYDRKKTPEPLGIALKDNPGKVIGTVGCFWVSKPSKSMELAYAIAEQYWGKGIVAEASRAIVDYCFTNFDVQRIQSRCKTENKASARVMEKAGMTYEGTLKSAIFHRNRFWDMHYYSVLKSQWSKHD